ncbi:hypothetical protein TGME49_279310 [Toxoplasma gondii ME49]|uniref:Uncharacterized protein n=2 Tax=Toxoplasma gondii TaxID=5811 RepID=S8G734_TOXGM|nr:hypothetical protein TGME49_279310 [Toxoplasma gondii ME49]EPT27535.1 hypothetical protein TGME49_279310 [Toxoplasma gondii ME49]KYF45658.1 hypothetical protein TGARI_279310 [Toxoplasma gondii ARI]|eukprot:XP_002371971.1 hypothetical protein TGME49_279310 [Toxoplasma gondii ME49]
MQNKLNRGEVTFVEKKGEKSLLSRKRSDSQTTWRASDLRCRETRGSRGRNDKDGREKSQKGRGLDDCSCDNKPRKRFKNKDKFRRRNGRCGNDKHAGDASAGKRPVLTARLWQDG